MATIKTLNKFLCALFLAATMAFVIGCAGTPTQEGTGEYVDDTLITAKVKAAILEDPALELAQVNVETFKSTVQLSGFVASKDAANRAV